MPIISKETWDNLIPEEEKKALKEYYADIAEGEIFEEGKISAFQHIFGEEVLQPQPLTYEDVARELFKDKETFFIENNGYILKSHCTETHLDTNNCTSKKQCEKLLAINKLLNVARFLNGEDWKPDFNRGTPKYQIGLVEDALVIISVATNNSSSAYFRTEELAKQAIQILGEDVTRVALTTEY